MKEEDRLAAVVATIDEEAAVVPRGAYVKAPLGDVLINKSFKGLCISAANLCVFLRQLLCSRLISWRGKETELLLSFSSPQTTQ